jgi:hypothetical protein
MGKKKIEGRGRYLKKRVNYIYIYIYIYMSASECVL